MTGTRYMEFEACLDKCPECGVEGEFEDATECPVCGASLTDPETEESDDE